MTFQLCLFDLDDTLVSTSDLKEIREAGKSHASSAYREKLESAFFKQTDRNIYSEAQIVSLREKFPEMKIGVFTRSPRSYAETVLSLAFPNTSWDTIVSYEDVKRTKPFGDGIDEAMSSFGFKTRSRVVLVGDGDSDIRAAYNAGCVVVLDRSSWNDQNRSYDNWDALGRIPDADISTPDGLIPALAEHQRMLPDLERRLVTDDQPMGLARFDRVNKFIPKSVGGDKTAFPIHVCGRHFSNYKSLDWRRGWHELTQSIHDHKDANEFPQEWVDSVKAFIRANFSNMFVPQEVLVTVIPHRPGRKPRFEKFLSQIEASIAAKGGVGKADVSFDPGLLAYKEGVRSNSNDKLTRDERFKNIRDHLYVAKPEVAKAARNVLILDDVCTSGSSMIYAKKRLEESGAVKATCLALAMNIGNVLYD